MIQLDTSWLQHVQKPARYTGGEYNSIVKDHSTVAVSYTHLVSLIMLYRVLLKAMIRIIPLQICNKRY